MFLLVSLKFLLFLKSFNGVSRQFKGCLKIKGSFKSVSSKFQECFIQGSFREFSSVFQESFYGVSNKISGHFK